MPAHGHKCTMVVMCARCWSGCSLAVPRPILHDSHQCLKPCVAGSELDCFPPLHWPPAKARDACSAISIIIKPSSGRIGQPLPIALDWLMFTPNKFFTNSFLSAAIAASFCCCFIALSSFFCRFAACLSSSCSSKKVFTGGAASFFCFLAFFLSTELLSELLLFFVFFDFFFFSFFFFLSFALFLDLDFFFFFFSSSELLSELLLLLLDISGCAK
mmetsp:Transcript_93308/g.165100  ORF Transcript_93308/g.165100 Transcript_93308/m.165100 type:complete len:215 (+) Transcript_93308:112-756(+)